VRTPRAAKRRESYEGSAAKTARAPLKAAKDHSCTLVLAGGRDVSSLRSGALVLPGFAELFVPCASFFRIPSRTPRTPSEWVNGLPLANTAAKTRGARSAAPSRHFWRATQRSQILASQPSHFQCRQGTIDKIALM